jgi:hypothetical protein
VVDYEDFRRLFALPCKQILLIKDLLLKAATNLLDGLNRIVHKHGYVLKHEMSELAKRMLFQFPSTLLVLKNVIDDRGS